MSGSEPRVAAKSNKRVFVGRVSSDRMDKTIVIEITTRKMHRLYKKYMAHSKKLKAHDENNEAHIGDVVRVIEARPMSKEKRWRLVEILERAR